MTDIICTYTGNRDEALVAYLYDDYADSGAADRTAFEAHLRTCARCRTDLKALGGVREQLSRWNPPEPRLQPSAISHEPSAIRNDIRWWQAIPTWAQVAAAVLVLGASIGMANFDIRYDAGGLTIRTGWMPPAKVADAATSSAQPAAVTRDELVAFEQRLQTELRDQQPVPVQTRATDPEVMRRVKTIVEESEKIQKRELALKIAEAFSDFDAQRRQDLASVGVVQNKAGFQILRQQQQLDQMNNMLRQAVSLRVPQQ